jgi:hypothetical protein
MNVLWPLKKIVAPKNRKNRPNSRNSQIAVEKHVETEKKDGENKQHDNAAHSSAIWNCPAADSSRLRPNHVGMTMPPLLKSSLATQSVRVRLPFAVQTYPALPVEVPALSDRGRPGRRSAMASPPGRQTESPRRRG